MATNTNNSRIISAWFNDHAGEPECLRALELRQTAAEIQEKAEQALADGLKFRAQFYFSGLSKIMAELLRSDAPVCERAAETMTDVERAAELYQILKDAEDDLHWHALNGRIEDVLACRQLVAQLRIAVEAAGISAVSDPEFAECDPAIEGINFFGYVQR